MKKLKVLIAILFLISTVSSAQGTKDTTISVPKPVAKEIVKDIIRGDSAINELNIIKQNLGFEKEKSLAKDGIINNLNQQIGVHKEKETNFNNIIFLKDSQIELEQEVSKKLAADLRAIKRKRTFMQIAGTAIIGGLAYLYLTK